MKTLSLAAFNVLPPSLYQCVHGLIKSAGVVQIIEQTMEVLHPNPRVSNTLQHPPAKASKAMLHPLLSDLNQLKTTILLITSISKEVAYFSKNLSKDLQEVYQKCNHIITDIKGHTNKIDTHLEVRQRANEITNSELRKQIRGNEKTIFDLEQQQKRTQINLDSVYPPRTDRRPAEITTERQSSWRATGSFLESAHIDEIKERSSVLRERYPKLNQENNILKEMIPRIKMPDLSLANQNYCITSQRSENRPPPLHSLSQTEKKVTRAPNTTRVKTTCEENTFDAHNEAAQMPQILSSFLQILRSTTLNNK